MSSDVCVLVIPPNMAAVELLNPNQNFGLIQICSHPLLEFTVCAVKKYFHKIILASDRATLDQFTAEIDIWKQIYLPAISTVILNPVFESPLSLSDTVFDQINSIRIRELVEQLHGVNKLLIMSAASFMHFDFGEIMRALDNSPGVCLVHQLSDQPFHSIYVNADGVVEKLSSNQQTCQTLSDLQMYGIRVSGIQNVALPEDNVVAFLIDSLGCNAITFLPPAWQASSIQSLIKMANLLARLFPGEAVSNAAHISSRALIMNSSIANCDVEDGVLIDGCIVQSACVVEEKAILRNCFVCAGAKIVRNSFYQDSIISVTE